MEMHIENYGVNFHVNLNSCMKLFPGYSRLILKRVLRGTTIFTTANSPCPENLYEGIAGIPLSIILA